MSRGYRFGVFATLFTFAIAIHWVAIKFFRPDGPLQPLVDEAASPYIDAGFGDTLYQVFAQYLPLLLVGFAVLWLVFSEYEEQTVGVRRRR